MLVPYLIHCNQHIKIHGPKYLGGMLAWIPLGVHPGVERLNHRAVLFLALEGTSRLISIVTAAGVTFPPVVNKGSLPHILTNIRHSLS